MPNNENLPLNLCCKGVSRTLVPYTGNYNMRALRYHGPKDLRVEHDLPEPTCGDDQIKVKPAFVGICGA